MRIAEPGPDWWDWELELTAHLLLRMEHRGFTEVDLRSMMEDVVGLRADMAPGRGLVETRLDGATWELIVEPDRSRLALVVITAYRVQP